MDIAHFNVALFMEEALRTASESQRNRTIHGKFDWKRAFPSIINDSVMKRYLELGGDPFIAQWIWKWMEGLKMEVNFNGAYSSNRTTHDGQ